MVTFDSEPVDEFLSYAPGVGVGACPEFSANVEAIRQDGWVYRVVLCSDPVTGDRPAVVQRELHVFGHPALRQPLFCTAGFTLI